MLQNLINYFFINRKLENNKITEKNAEYSKMDGSFYYYIIEGFDETIFDKYFN